MASLLFSLEFNEIISHEYKPQHHSEFLSCTLQEQNFSSDLDREIKMGELRLRYVQLMRDFHTSLGEEKATDLINESVAIWKKLSIQK